MRGPHNIWRLIRTGATLERSGAMGIALAALDAPPALRVVARTLGWTFAWAGLSGDPALPPMARALSALGPAYIKFGQILSTRPDVVGGEVAQQLRVLQDRLPPFSIAEAQTIVAEELGRPTEEIFSRFSEPVAAASIAQVHKATRADTGVDVAVKVLRPGIERAFRRDIDAFYFVAGFIERLSPASRRLRPSEVVRHFEGVVMGELDLRLEAGSAAEFAENTAGDRRFRVPKVDWALTGRRMMTLDWVDGIPLGDIAAMDAAGIDRRELGERVIQLFLRHALRDGLFHGDMHHGNLQVAPDGTLIAYDFGIMGRIDEYTRRVYAEILYGFIQKDYRRVAEVHFEAGYVPSDRSIEEFARALRGVGEPIFGMDASRISMGRLLSYLFEVTERFGMQTRTELILLQRTMVVAEGVARSLNPNINMWQAARPVVEEYIRENLGPKAALRDLGRTARVMARFGPRLPALVEASLIRQSEPRLTLPPPRRLHPALWFLSGAAVAMAGVAMGLAI